MDNHRIALINARLLNPQTNLDAHGSVLIEDGKIIDFGPHLFREGAPSVSRVIDCQGLCLAPGLIDARVHISEPAEPHKETLLNTCQSALAGGVTSIVALPDTTPVIESSAMLAFFAAKSQSLPINIFCYGALTKGLKGEEMTNIGSLKQAGVVGFTDTTKAIANSRIMRQIFTYAASHDALVIQHPEDPELSKDGVMAEGELSCRLGLNGIPEEAEALIIERDLRLLESFGGRYHVAHITTREGIELVRQAKKKGLRVTCDTAPHYFTLNEIAIGDYRTFTKVCPPLRREEDRQAVVEGLTDGTIDFIASDHTPHDEDTKRLPFSQAAFGIIGIQSLLPLSLALYHQGSLTLLETIALVTHKPAKILGLSVGKLAVGHSADLILFDPDTPWVMKKDYFINHNKNTPFENHPVQGCVIASFYKGICYFKSSNTSLEL